MNALEMLAPYKAWKLYHYTQPFDDGRVQDPVYVCSVLVDDEWTREEYGRTPELAVLRALGKEDEA